MDEHYTKADYITAKDYAILHNLPFDLVEKAMEYAHKRNIKAALPRRPAREIIIRLPHQKAYHLRPEPEVQQKFSDILKQLQEKVKQNEI